MPPSIGRSEVRSLLQQNAQLVEVLPRDQFEAEHLPGALNIPLKELTAQAAAALARARPIIVYCQNTQ